MRTKPNVRCPLRTGLGRLLAGAAVLALVSLASPATAQEKAPQQPPVETDKPTPPDAQPVPPSDGDRPVLPMPDPREAKPEQGKKKAGCGSDDGKKKKGSDTLSEDENARWACDITTVNLEPVWSGAQITFGFDIRNEGTAPLKIKAKGG